VDDEVLLRVGLKTTINWEEAGFTVVAEAANGEQGYEQYKKHEPDMVITDIRMPQKDGLWLVEEIRKENPHIPILVLTCLDEFSYARNALKVGADDYILKSEVEDEELLSMLSGVKKKLDKLYKDKEISQTASISKNDIRRMLFNDLVKSEFQIDGKLQDRFEVIDVPLRNTRFMFVSVSVSKDHSLLFEKQVSQAVINLFINLLDDREIAYLYHIVSNRYHFLLSSSQLGILELKHIFLSANQGAQQYFDQALHIVFTDTFEESSMLNDWYIEFLDKSEVMFYIEDSSLYLENTKNIHFEELNSVELKKKYSQMLLIDSIMKENMEGAKEFGGELYKYFKTKFAHPNSVKMFFTDLMNHLFDHYAQLLSSGVNKLDHNHYHFEIINAASLKKTCTIMEQMLIGFIEQMRQYVQNNSQLLTNQAVNYIQQNFDKKISLKDVAESLNLSKQYLCSIFKKETGENVSFYINKLRIEKAKMLLHKKDRKIKEIFEEVGYSNQQYFSKVFKKMTGMTILEYKDNINP
jgi:two-component system response regulator YesN